MSRTCLEDWESLGELLRERMVSALEPETLLKILELQELLRKEFSVRRALKAMDLEWRNYYKYAPIIYMDPKTTYTIT